LKANVISLIHSSRRSIALHRGSSVGLDISFFDAIDASIDPSVSKTIVAVQSQFRARYGRPQTPGEIANLFSHQALYKDLLLSSLDYHLILEDDFIPLVNASSLERVIKTASLLFADVIILGYSKVDDELEAALNLSNPLMNVVPVPGENLVIGQRCHESTCGAVSYAVSKRFLTLMTKNLEFGLLTDDWTFHEKLRLKILHVRPLCFREDFLSMPSLLECERKVVTPKIRMRLPKLTRPIWRRWLGIFRRIQFYVRVFGRKN
jgi:GR25 family glycosyltransferase involved in LPS biosynthesis